MYQKLDVRHVIKHLKSHHAVVLEKRNYGLSLTYDRQKHLANTHMDIATIYNLQILRNLMQSLDNTAHLEQSFEGGSMRPRPSPTPLCFIWNLMVNLDIVYGIL